MSKCTVSYLWREPQAAEDFSTGVSLHSHTSQSRETLDFIAELASDRPLLKPLIAWGERRAVQSSGIRPKYADSYWTPPLTPRLAFDLERTQIENSLGKPGLVSISDHDDISAPMLLRAVSSARHVPVSLEWSIPYSSTTASVDSKPTAFHIGIHNLPSAEAADWVQRLNEFTAWSLECRPEYLLSETLAALDAIPNVLIVFNHPLWDLYRIGRDAHEFLVNDFLLRYGNYIHALELNGLRDWAENRQVRALASRWNQLVISGGDRHGIEPNANINLSHASTFNDFVYEVRRERVSHVLFMPQYQQPWKHRILQSTLDAIRDYPHFPEGHRTWDERVYVPDLSGSLRRLSEVWIEGRPDGKAPPYVSLAIKAVRLMGSAPVSGGLRWAWDESQEMRAALMQGDA